MEIAYLERFNKLVEELHAHPKVEVLTYHTFPAVQDQVIQKIEQAIGKELDANIKKFYKETNGLQLRWILTSNEDFNSSIHRFDEAVLGWDYAAVEYRPEDGCILFLPIEDAFEHSFKNIEPNVSEILSIEGTTYTLPAFFEKIKPFDQFSHYCNMVFFLDQEGSQLVLMGDEEHLCYTDSRITNFESYIEFLLATKGVAQKRKQFYGHYQGYKMSVVETLQDYWTEQNGVDLDTLVFVQEFPLADQPGTQQKNIDTRGMQDRAQRSEVMTQEAIEKMIHEHFEFLNSGGIGGRWQSMLIKNVVFGVYLGAKSERGRQAILDMQKIPQNVDLQEAQLPYSSWCGVYARYQDFSDADLTGSLMTDANLEKTIFVDANLENVDFSRANLRGASFMNANLRGADFENCDLTDTDFRGAILEGARFPGAKLKGVLR
ncbi:MAG: pentapeptide repeat-containing protein [Aureispira sp.]|nr:pentapeptide repeat-containing protein [Aureispira sp.]